MTASRRTVAAFAAAAALLPTPALAQTAPDATASPTATTEPTATPTATATPTTPPPTTAPPTATPTATDEPAPIAPDIAVEVKILDYGQETQLAVFGEVGARVQLYGNGRVIREDTIQEYDDESGIFVWDLQPGQTTTFFALVDGVRTTSITVPVRRTVTIGIRQASGIYTFTGTIARPEAGVQVTVARLDAGTKRVTGVASARTDASGRYTIRTGLPVGQAGYYALTEARSGLDAGRSRLYGLIVPSRPVVTSPQTPALTAASVTVGVRSAGQSKYVISGRLTPGRSVPVTLAEVRDGRLVGVAGGRTSANGSYSFTVTLNQAANQTTRTFQVLTAAGQGLRAATSRPYGLVIPARPVVVTPAAESVSQRNARLKGASYLKYSSFSRSGLIRQLQYEGFSTADATYGTDVQRANWSAQAALKAASYLKYSSFSREGLLRQLEYEGFTAAEAEYGVSQVGY